MSLNFGHSYQELPGSFVGGIMEKDINMSGHNITNLPHPHGSKHAVRKQYVDDELNDKLDLGGGDMTGGIDMQFNNISNLPVPTNINAPATKLYVDAGDLDLVPRDGSRSMTDDLDLDDHKIINIDTPTDDKDAATKNYVDTQISGLTTVCNHVVFPFYSTNHNAWTRSRTEMVSLFWTKNRDIKITFFAHVFDSDIAIDILSLYYKIIIWSKTKVVKVIHFNKTNIAEDTAITGANIQMYELNIEKTVTDIKCFTMDFKYHNVRNIGNESGLHCLVEYI